VLNVRERRIFETRRLAEEPITLEELASEFGVSRELMPECGVLGFKSALRLERRLQSFGDHGVICC
jgi:RNA polymerase sigma-32 factor